MCEILFNFPIQYYIASLLFVYYLLNLFVIRLLCVLNFRSRAASHRKSEIFCRRLAYFLRHDWRRPQQKIEKKIRTGLHRICHSGTYKMSFLFRSSKTFKPKKNIPEGTHQYDLMKHAAATLGSGNLRNAVQLPDGEDLNEWVAVNTVDFFNQINMLYGTITEFCTEDSCSIMSAGPKYEYHWADGQTVKKPIKCSAPKYIDYLMTWVQDQLDDETLFPSKIGVPFPKNFIQIAKTILKRLFRVYAHIYHQHFSEVVRLSEEAHLNTSFKHFIYFVQEFNLIDRRELAPLQDLIDKLITKDGR